MSAARRWAAARSMMATFILFSAPPAAPASSVTVARRSMRGRATLPTPKRAALLTFFRCRPGRRTSTGSSSRFRWIRIYSSWNSISPALNRAAAASSGSLISTANARRSSAPRRGQAISALASTQPAQNCSGRYLKVWLTLSSTRWGYPQGGELYLTGGGAASSDLVANYCRLYRQNGGFQYFQRA